MVFPSFEALDVEVLLASATFLQIFIVFVHFGETDGTISVVLQVDDLGVLLAASHATPESLCQLLVEYFIGRLRYFGG